MQSIILVVPALAAVAANIFGAFLRYRSRSDDNRMKVTITTRTLRDVPPEHRPEIVRALAVLFGGTEAA